MRSKVFLTIYAACTVASCILIYPEISTRVYIGLILLQMSCTAFTGALTTKE